MNKVADLDDPANYRVVSGPVVDALHYGFTTTKHLN